MIMHAKSVSCGYMVFMRCSLGSCTCRMYTCKPVEMHLNHIPLFPFGSNHTLSDRSIGNTHHDSHGNPHHDSHGTVHHTTTQRCWLHNCWSLRSCVIRCSVCVHHVWYTTVLLLCPSHQKLQKMEEELYARLTLICFT